jgi:hypothetical protein
MKYGDNFDDYYEILIEIPFNGLSALEEMKSLIEGIIALLDLKGENNEQFNKTKNHCREQFEIDLKLVIKAMARDSEQGIEDGFYEAKKELKTDLRHAASKFRFIGY